MIGIEDDSAALREKRPPYPGSRQARHLVFHSGRHAAATRLAEAIGSEMAAKITRYQSIRAFMGYADHDMEEGIEETRKGLSVTQRDEASEKQDKK